jgi:PAS domain S-box-containing protein
MKKITFLTGILTIVVSILVMLGWLFDIKPLLSIVHGAATMKFNTALLFLFVGLSLLNSLYTEHEYSILDKVISLALILIGSITLIEYGLSPNFSIDKLFVEDKITDYLPGRMSGATAFCFILISLALIGIYSKKTILKRITQNILLVIILFAMVSIESFILQIPTRSRIFFLNSMALHTSILFVLVSISLAFVNPTLGFMGLLTGNLTGSKILGRSLLILILIPLTLSFFWLSFTNRGWIEKDFGIAIYTIVSLFIFLLFIGNLAIRLNHIDRERNALDEALIDANKELSYFKQGLDESFSVAKSNARGKIHYVNDNLCSATKQTKDELLGKDYKTLISPRHSSNFYNEILQEILSGRIWKGEIELQTAEDRYSWSQVIIVPYKNKKGNIYQHLYIAQDISDRKRNEDLIARYISEIEQKNTELDEYGHITSHDLQEPLRTIVSFIDVFKSEYSNELNDHAKMLLNYIDQSAERMRELITGLLEHANIGQSKILEPISCDAILNNLGSDLLNLIERNNVILKIDKLPEIVGNPLEIRLLFQNLIINAIKFRNPDRRPIVEINGKTIENGWEFSITDNGIGIPKNSRNKIFTIFSRLNHRDQFEGVGIGLAHSKKIVKNHGGKIWVESNLKEGSTFFFNILLKSKI